MEWLLLYPIIGLGLGIYYAIHYHKHGHSDDATVALVIVMVVLWPIGWWPSARDIRGYRAEVLETEAREHEAFLERVRAEARATHRRQIAEFDKELGIEPAWKKAHPGAASEYEALCFRAGYLPNYSKGGRL